MPGQSAGKVGRIDAGPALTGGGIGAVVIGMVEKFAPHNAMGSALIYLAPTIGLIVATVGFHIGDIVATVRQKRNGENAIAYLRRLANDDDIDPETRQYIKGRIEYLRRALVDLEVDRVGKAVRAPRQTTGPRRRPSA
jgi:hypothetical protein